jgi:hypothetical protein
MRDELRTLALERIAELERTAASERDPVHSLDRLLAAGLFRDALESEDSQRIKLDLNARGKRLSTDDLRRVRTAQAILQLIETE